MTTSIQTFDFKMVNAYLVGTGSGFMLIDTGISANRKQLDGMLRHAGCQPGDLKLIVITHGDADHCGNAAYLRKTYGAKIATHNREAPSVEQGDMFLSRGAISPSRRMLKPLMSLFRLKKADRFVPDLFLDDGDCLESFGLDATILHLPGHTTGSVAVLTADGALFSGDFLQNRTRPSVATFVDDATALQVGLDRLKMLNIRTVYPGHGKSFAMSDIQ